MPRPRLFTIAPHAPFLATLAERILDGRLPGYEPALGPLGLADLTILLPTRRARLTLADIFASRCGGAVVLPDIRSFSDLPGEDEPFLPMRPAEPLPQAIGLLDRRLTLASLIGKWMQTRDALPLPSGFSSPPSPAEILALADSLAELIDDCEIAGVPLGQIASIPPESLAENFQQSLQFLEIALAVWPEILKERALADAAAVRNLGFSRLAATVPDLYGGRAVIAAGSTGSIAATADVLAAIAQLPHGALVLPGLDGTLTPEAHDRLLDTRRLPHGHPQHGLARLLRRLGAGPAEVEELAAGDATRTAAVRRALDLAEDTRDWPQARAGLGEPDLAAAFAGAGIIAARTEEEEARAIAVLARDALLRRQSVGIISPDRNLARRIGAELRRFAIVVDDSAGVPLFQSRAGRLVRQLVAAVMSDLAPVDLMALLRNRHTGLGLGRAAVLRGADLIELALLRGQRPAPGIAGLRAALAANRDRTAKHPAHRVTPGEAQEIEAVLAALAAALQPLSHLIDADFRASALAGAIERSLAALASGVEIAGDPGEGFGVLSDWCADMARLTDSGPLLARSGIVDSLEGLMRGMSVRGPGGSRDDLAIWGQLEARLQNPDLLVLAGLNEGMWPEVADPGPWLSRGMRLAAGLEPPERRQGQAAHDFEMALGNSQVMLCFSERIGNAPALPSRLLQRLRAFVGKPLAAAMRGRGAPFIAQARRLDAAGAAQPAPRPSPSPPAAARPRRLSITEVETLIRSPYDLYARHVLGLRRLDPLGDDPDTRERGTMLHEVFGRFIAEGHDPMAADALARLMQIGGEVFSVLDDLPARREGLLKRLAAQAEAFLAFERERDGRVAKRHAEVDGAFAFTVEGEAFELRGRADRIDLLRDGRAEILDFKSGAVPSKAERQAYLAPQLLLEAKMMREGQFAGLPRAEAAQLDYIKLGFGPEALQVTSFEAADGGIMGAAEEVFTRLHARLGAFLFSSTMPMSAHILPRSSQRWRGDYDHLARTDEWTVVDGGEDEP